ncbi:hypothetical protein POSPLADRAFT_1058779 [Postia placenta MAD-698-R-SB12]|uniref:DUF967 domain protein n=1 Tax=Postia placenta MAD-698-R-SB12 TaxID=670580 RepID=A0A1X6MWM6_9APHY|nr:hypothetical protein POSPLADRAFT_1058779 [Postia placenta MAD-698-R-SB12]OSX60613.1 hypothetical protein POSPLADRAFT_1058779 [Postia placenta MAD-698-R-SB12]
MSLVPIRAPPTDLGAIAAEEARCVFTRFTANTAWTLGSLLRDRLRRGSTRPAVVNITLANSDQLLFHAASGSGTGPDNDIWVARKRRAVLRWGASTWALHNKYKGDEAAFAAKFQLGPRGGDYAIHGGGFPVRVKGVEGIVGVIVVSGLTMQEDHEVIVEVIEEYLQKVDAGEIQD